MTTSRRDFLGIAAAGSAVAASGVFSGGTSAAPADMSQAGGRAGRYVPPVKFGLGGVPLGNEFEVVSDEDAYHTLEAAWNAGVRYYDVAPWYGLGLLSVLPVSQQRHIRLHGGRRAAFDRGQLATHGCQSA